jgi:hypothetical protein
MVASSLNPNELLKITGWNSAKSGSTRNLNTIKEGDVKLAGNN